MNGSKALVWRTLAAMADASGGFGKVSDVRVLAYHGVPDGELFARQAEIVHRWFHVLGEGEVIEYLRTGAIERPGCWITFDDGDPTVVENALPVLERLGLPATLFACPGYVDGDEPFWWNLVDIARTRGLTCEVDGGEATVGRLKQTSDIVRREVVADLTERMKKHAGEVRRRQITTDQLHHWADSGRTIGNHTWDHPVLDQCAPEEQKEQIDRAHEWLKARFGPARSFAYPNGNRTAVAQSHLAALSYSVAVLFDHRLSKVNRSLAMSRVRVNATDPIEVFKAKVSGIHPALHRLRGGS